MAADVELAGIVADDDGVRQQAMRLDAAPQCAFGGDLDRIWIDRERGDAEPVEMRQEGRLIGKAPVRMLGQAGDHVGRELALAHIGQRFGVDDVIIVTGTQQREEIAAAL